MFGAAQVFALGGSEFGDWQPPHFTSRLLHISFDEAGSLVGFQDRFASHEGAMDTLEVNEFAWLPADANSVVAAQKKLLPHTGYPGVRRRLRHTQRLEPCLPSRR